MQELGVETGVQKVQHRVLHAADVHVYRQVLVGLLTAHQLLIVVVVHVAQEIPGGTCPLGHSVRLSLGRSAADRTSGVHPAVDGCQRGLAGTRRLIAFHLRKLQRKLILRHRHIAAVGAVDDRNRLAPVALAGEYPVAQLVVHRLLAHAHLFDDMGRFLLQHRGLHAVPVSGVDHGAAGLGIGLGHIFDFFSVFCDNLDDRNVKFLRELKVAVVMGRHAHDGSRAVIRQYIV